ncbi:MAG: peptidase M1, partial [Bacteroidota bacterium]
LAFTLWRFNFQYFLSPSSKSAKLTTAQQRGAAAGAKTLVRPAKKLPLPTVDPSFSLGGYWQQMFSQASIEFRNILRDPYFLAIVSGAILFLFFDGWSTNSTLGTRNYPTTYYMLQIKDNVYILFVLIIIVFYTGEVIHRDRSVGFHQIADALPLPNWVAYGGKLLTLTVMTFLLATTVWVVGVISQTIQGYHRYEFGQYFTDLYLLTWPRYLVMLSLAFFVHVLANQKFLGHVLAILFYVAFFFLPDIVEFDYKLLIFGSQPDYLVSDMNGFGHFIPAVSWFNAYWLALGLVLVLLGLLFYARGTDNAWSSRLRRFRKALGPKTALGLAVATGIFIFCGFIIYHNVSVKNEYFSRAEVLDLKADYERSYRSYLSMEHPKIFSVDLAVDIFPEDRRTVTAAKLGVVNRTGRPVDSLMLAIPFSDRNGRLDTFLVAGHTVELLRTDGDHDIAFFRLHPALAPGDSTTLRFVTERFFSGFPNGGFQEEILHNGTFFDHDDVIPSFGYKASREIRSETERKKRGLEIRDYLLPPATDVAGGDKMLYTPNADLISFRAVVSTAPDQIAIAPGRLQREWVDNGRRYFEYAEPETGYYFNITSARYVVDEDAWTGPDGEQVDIQIFRQNQ